MDLIHVFLYSQKQRTELPGRRSLHKHAFSERNFALRKSYERASGSHISKCDRPGQADRDIR